MLSLVVGSGGFHANVPELESKTLVETLYYDVYKDNELVFNVDFTIANSGSGFGSPPDGSGYGYGS